jgi:uncharacterized integral membrane protein
VEKKSLTVPVWDRLILLMIFYFSFLYALQNQASVPVTNLFDTLQDFGKYYSIFELAVGSTLC